MNDEHTMQGENAKVHAPTISANKRFNAPFVMKEIVMRMKFLPFRNKSIISLTTSKKVAS